VRERVGKTFVVEGPPRRFLKGSGIPNIPLKQGASATMVLTHLPFFLVRDTMAEWKKRKERGISSMSACKKERADASDPEKGHTNSGEGYPQEAAVGILNNPSAAFVDNPRSGVDDL